MPTFRAVNWFVANKGPMTITDEQCRAARALLNRSQPDLAEAVGMTQKTITHFETDARTPHPNNLAALPTFKP